MRHCQGSYITFSILAAAVVISAGIAAFIPTQSGSAAAQERFGSPGGWGRTDQSNATSAPEAGLALSQLSESEVQALQYAVLEEYGAYNLYSAVIEQFGSAYPFPQIAHSEQQHLTALLRQGEKYGIEVPANPGLANPSSFADLSAACQAGVAAEVADAAHYDGLKTATTHADVIRVYDRLQSAFLNSHLPLFETCD